MDDPISPEFSEEENENNNKDNDWNIDANSEKKFLERAYFK